MLEVLGFRKNSFIVGGDRHIQYFHRQFGFVLRRARTTTAHKPYSAGLHHFCLRVESVADVKSVAEKLFQDGIEATAAKLYPEYAPDYWATFFSDPDGIRLEVTNHRQERRDRHELGETRTVGRLN